MTIKTNRHWYTPVSWYDLPKAAQADFDYIPEDSRNDYRIVRYRGAWYDLYEFGLAASLIPHLRPDARDGFADWQGYQSDSFFSGVLFRYDDDFERVQMATYSV